MTFLKSENKLIIRDRLYAIALISNSSQSKNTGMEKNTLGRRYYRQNGLCAGALSPLRFLKGWFDAGKLRTRIYQRSTEYNSPESVYDSA
jgi:hypothetical protein